MSFRCTNLRPTEICSYLYVLYRRIPVRIRRKCPNNIVMIKIYCVMENSSSVILEINTMSIFGEDLYSILFRHLSLNIK